MQYVGAVAIIVMGTGTWLLACYIFCLSAAVIFDKVDVCIYEQVPLAELTWALFFVGFVAAIWRRRRPATASFSEKVAFSLGSQEPQGAGGKMVGYSPGEKLRGCALLFMFSTYLPDFVIGSTYALLGKDDS